ncbi:hypothetical protein KKD03_04570 [Patescibacteria group bacterium]|nr:hypothetical protein [Patescibacteria group bacterium]
MKTNDIKRDRFKKLAEKRTNVLLQKMKILGNCSNRSVYEYSETDVAKIFSAIEQKIRETKAKFHFPKSQKFKL